MYWIWRAHDRVVAANIEINWNRDLIYWLLSYTGIVLFNMTLCAYPLFVLGLQFVIGLMVLLPIRPINGKWFHSLLSIACCGIISMITEVLLSRYELDYATGISEKDDKPE
jgi:hypothetical protein